MPLSKRRAQSASIRRLVPQRVAGIPAKSDAPFWRGERAEAIVAARAEATIAEKAAKKLATVEKRAAAKLARGETPRPARARGEQRTTREPQPGLKRLRRLERALGRRKTLAARQRVQQRIDDLKRELGL